MPIWTKGTCLQLNDPFSLERVVLFGLKHHFFRTAATQGLKNLLQMVVMKPQNREREKMVAD